MCVCVFDLFLYTRFLYGFFTYFSSVSINNQTLLKGSCFLGLDADKPRLNSSLSDKLFPRLLRLRFLN